MAELRERLEKGLTALELSLLPGQLEQLLDYLALLVKWNRAYNLTAVRDPQQMVTRHLLDSLAVLPHLGPGRMLDVGSGAGLPGIPTAIAEPQRPVVLLDSNGKKTRFLTQAVAELGLENASVVHSRLEQYRPDGLFDVVISRAFASLADMLEGARHLIAPGGRFVAMKGAYPVAELDAVPEGFEILGVEALEVPGLGAERHLVYARVAPPIEG